MAADARPPPGASGQLYVVVRPGGERHYIEKETPEGIREWAKGLDATILEYEFKGVVHRPPLKSAKSASAAKVGKP